MKIRRAVVSEPFSELGVPVGANGVTGLALVALSALCFGTNPILARFSYEAGADPTTYLFLRCLIASPVMYTIMRIRGFQMPRGRQLLELLLVGGIGAGTTFCFYTAIYYAPVNLIIVITYMYPTFVMLFSVVFLKRAISAFKVAALLLSLAGIAFAVGLGNDGYGLGILLAFLAAICHSVYLILGSRSIQKAGSFQATTVIIISSALIYGVYVGINGLQLPLTFHGWAATTTSALVSTALGLVVFFAGLKRIDTANAAIVSTFEVVVTASLAVAFLGESLSIQKGLGAVLVMASVLILAKEEYATVSARNAYHPANAFDRPR